MSRRNFHTQHRFSTLAGCLLLSLTILGAAGCGGGSGASAPPGAAVLLATYQADMTGDQEPLVLNASAHAFAVVEIWSDGSVEFGVSFPPGSASSVSGVTLKRGTFGNEGPVLADFLLGGTFLAGTDTLSGETFVSTTLASEISSDPAGHYVELHTGGDPTGLCRGQLAPGTPTPGHALMLGTKEVVVVNSAARGAASFVFESPRHVRFLVAMQTPAVAAVTGVTVNAGFAGANGPSMGDLLNATDLVVDHVRGTISGSVDAALGLVARLGRDPASVYVNVRTAAAAQGVCRGQLGTESEAVWCRLRGADVVPPVIDPLASAGVALLLDSMTTGTTIYAVPSALGIDNVTAATIREGAAGVNGATVIDLRAGVDFVTSPASFSAEGTITYDVDTFTRILGNPGAFYASIDTAAFAGGLARAQLGVTPVPLSAAMTGAEELIQVDLLASSTLNLFLDDPHHCTFTLRSLNPTTTEIDTQHGLHIHDAPAGVNGPILIDLFSGTHAVGTETISGEADFSGRTAVRLMADAAHFYCNAHTPAGTTGEARGQCAVREGGPPTALTYTSPVTYSTTVPIAPNLPTSLGGAPTLYQVTPPLPAGLALNPTTGVISGTPAINSTSTIYTITASNSFGPSLPFLLDITVLLSPPDNLLYNSPVVYVQGISIAPNIPTFTGGPGITFTSPPLPTGLNLNATTGRITGIPTAAAGPLPFTITATNAAGFDTFVVTITISATLQAPSNIQYPESPAIWKTGFDITPDVPTVGGGAPTNWTVTPALPAGLSLSASTGTISGRPTAVTTAANYTITASNGAGSTPRILNITTPLGEPGTLHYQSPNIYYVGTAIPTNSPGVTNGGPITGFGGTQPFTVAPALPAGLQLNPTTGDITGTPQPGTQTSIQGVNVTVTATNAAGTSQQVVNLIIY